MCCIFEFSIYGDPIKDELQISKLKLAFSPHGQWFTSLSQDVLVAGTRVQDEAAFEESTAFNKTSFRGVSFNLTQKMQEQIYNDAKIGEFSSSFIRSEEESITPEMLNLFTQKGFNVEELNEEEIIISW